MTRIAILAAPLLLTGCFFGATPEPEIRTQTVYVDRLMSCVPENLRAAPEYPDTDEQIAASDGPADRYARVVAGRLLRIARLNEIEPVIEACREVKQ
ncbi:hypothetical protein [Alterisphingorhabdus coralli]|uniref:Lipoprotein n=1 Tax=Alterisphingorhabdus coralli TaxID=3071408 RepID=A0AA97F9A5_9SPHN|nr:hypothetical protein [Parasphingorhabdus sp. SCSIO 66989]WOE76333.1 hypothetical protein RB602_06370 [Parasphingorhabdus sp. SCSIO 66989]